MGLLASTNSRGFTLIELMVAIFIMTIGLLALMQTVNICILHNQANQIRNESVLVADEQMALEMTKPFNAVFTRSTSNVVPRTINNGTQNYTVTKKGSNVSDFTKSVLIVVTWQYRGQSYSHSIGSMISNKQ